MDLTEVMSGHKDTVISTGWNLAEIHAKENAEKKTSLPEKTRSLPSEFQGWSILL